MAKAGIMRDAMKRRIAASQAHDDEPDMMPESTNPNTQATPDDTNETPAEDKGGEELVGALPESGDEEEGHDYEEAFEDLEQCADKLKPHDRQEAQQLIGELRKLFEKKNKVSAENEGSPEDMPTGTGNSPLGNY